MSPNQPAADVALDRSGRGVTAARFYARASAQCLITCTVVALEDRSTACESLVEYRATAAGFLKTPAGHLDSGWYEVHDRHSGQRRFMQPTERLET